MNRLPILFRNPALRIASFNPHFLSTHIYYSTCSQPTTHKTHFTPPKVFFSYKCSTYRFKRQWIPETPLVNIYDPLTNKPTFNDIEQEDTVIMDIDEMNDVKECATPKGKHTHRRKRVKNAEKGRIPFVNAIICRVCYRKKRPGAKCKNCIGVRSKTEAS